MRKYKGMTQWIVFEIKNFGNDDVVIPAGMNRNGFTLEVSTTSINLGKPTFCNLVWNAVELIFFHSGKMHCHCLL